MINGHLINHYYIIELFNDLMGKNRFPQSGPKPLTQSIAKTANAINLKESCPLKPSLEDSNETSDP